MLFSDNFQTCHRTEIPFCEDAKSDPDPLVVNEALRGKVVLVLQVVLKRVEERTKYGKYVHTWLKNTMPIHA